MKFKVIAERFVEYLKNGEYDKDFTFVVNDGLNDFTCGITYVSEFDNWTFVVGMYGDGSTTTMRLLTFEEFLEMDWDDYTEEIAEFLNTEYDYLTPVI